MKAAETSASIATAAWTPLTVVSRSRTTAEIETFMSDVSMTNTNIAAANRMARRGVLTASSAISVLADLHHGRCNPVNARGRFSARSWVTPRG
jgi:hypothetical protein